MPALPPPPLKKSSKIKASVRKHTYTLQLPHHHSVRVWLQLSVIDPNIVLGQSRDYNGLRTMSPAEGIKLLLFSILVLINLVGNTLVCVVVLRTKSMRIPMNFLLVNLAIADMTVGLFLTPVYILRPLIRQADSPLGDVLCKLLTGGNFSWIGSAASVFTLVLIAFERYLSIMFPHNRKRNLTSRNAKLGILLCWLMALSSEIPPILVMRYNAANNICIEDWSNVQQARIYTVITFFIDFVIPFTLMAVLYGRVLCKLWNNKLCRATHVALLRRRKKVTMVLFIVTLLHAICLLPDTVAYFLSYFGFGNGSTAYMIGTAFICLHSAVNPFLYSLHSERFKRSLRSIFRCNTNAPGTCTPRAQKKDKEPKSAVFFYKKTRNVHSIR